MAESIQVTAKARVKLGSRENKRPARTPALFPAYHLRAQGRCCAGNASASRSGQALWNMARICFDLNVEGKSEKVLVKEVQYDHLGIEVLHVDFARVSLDENG